MYSHRLSQCKFRELQEVIDNYLYRHDENQCRDSKKQIFSEAEEDILFPFEFSLKQKTSPETGKAKRQKQAITRLCLKQLAFNQTIINKSPISLVFPRRKQSQMQISFNREGHKFKLSFPPIQDLIFIRVTQSRNELVIQAKNALLLEYEQQKKWIEKSIFVNIVIKANYQAKKYDQNTIENFFKTNRANYQITDPQPVVKIPPLVYTPEIPHSASQSTSQEKTEYPFMELVLPFNPDIDLPIELMLDPILSSPCQQINNDLKSVSNCQPQGNSVLDSYSQNKQITSDSGNQQQQNDPLRHPRANKKIKMSRSSKLDYKSDIKTEYDQQTKSELNSECRFKPLTPEQLQQSEQDLRNISKLDLREKESIITDIFKIKKITKAEYCIEKRRFTCPIHSCRKLLQEAHQLRIHLLTEHPELGRNGIRVGSDGRLQYSQTAINYVLQLAWLYPTEIKKIIKTMKTIAE